MTALSSSAWWLLPNPVSFHDVVAQCPAEMGSDLALWEQHFGGSLEADRKSLAGRAKRTSLTQDRDGTGLRRGQKKRMEEQ